MSNRPKISKKNRPKYSFTSLQDKITNMMMAHFPDSIIGDDMECHQCMDFRMGNCLGENRKGETVCDCMLQKVINNECQTIQGPTA